MSFFKNVTKKTDDFLEPSNLSKVKYFSATICEQIRWKRAHIVVAPEIENHIYDQRDAYIAQGVKEDTATDKAIIEMGDPISIGLDFDKTHRPKPQWIMIILTFTLFSFGLTVQYLMNAAYGLSSFRLLPYVLGFSAFGIAYFLDFTIFRKIPHLLYSTLLALSTLGLLFFDKVNGVSSMTTAYSSFSLAFITLLFPFAYSLVIYSCRNKGLYGLLSCGCSYFVLAMITLSIPSMSGLFLLTISGLVTLTVAICKGWFSVNQRFALAIIYIPTGLAIVPTIAKIVNPYHYYHDRFLAIFDPSSNPQGSGFYPLFIQEIISNAPFIGTSSIQSVPPGDIIPIGGNGLDYLLTYLLAIWGWIGVLPVLIAFLIFIVFGFYHVGKQKNILGFLCSLSIMITLAFQILFYVLCNFGYVIIYPISVPLLSSNMVGMIINMVLIGILLSVFRSEDIIKDRISLSNARNKRIFEIDKGRFIINFK